jgi:hypothetical protein
MYGIAAAQSGCQRLLRSLKSSLRPVRDLAARVAGPPGLQASRTPPQDHPRLHFDLHVADAAEQEAEAARLVSLGASRIDWDSYPDDPDFIVLADPDGNRFCIVDLGHEFR